MSKRLTTTVDGKAALRDKRAQGIAAMGLVTRECDRFRVATPSLRGRTAGYEVWRDDAGVIRCSCLEYEEHASEDSSFRCEHILAVKHSLLAKNSEALGTASREKALASTSESAPLPAGEANESTRPEVAGASQVQPDGALSNAEQEEKVEVPVASESIAPISNLRSLARPPVTEELEMPTEHDRYTAAEATVDKEPEIDPLAQPEIPVVPPGFINTLRALRQQIEPAETRAIKGWAGQQENRRLVELVEWHAIVDVLDRIVPTWSYSIRNLVQIGHMVAVTAAITIDGVTREGVGTGAAESAVGIEQAEREALKRAAVKFGVTRDCEERDLRAREEATGSSSHFLSDPLAKSMADLVTPKQLGMMRALAREAAVNVEDECQSIYRCKTGELSKHAASAVIIHLQGLPQAAEERMRRAS